MFWVSAHPLMRQPHPQIICCYHVIVIGKTWHNHRPAVLDCVPFPLPSLPENVALLGCWELSWPERSSPSPRRTPKPQGFWPKNRAGKPNTAKTSQNQASTLHISSQYNINLKSSWQVVYMLILRHASQIDVRTPRCCQLHPLWLCWASLPHLSRKVPLRWNQQPAAHPSARHWIQISC